MKERPEVTRDGNSQVAARLNYHPVAARLSKYYHLVVARLNTTIE